MVMREGSTALDATVVAVSTDLATGGADCRYGGDRGNM